MLHVKHLSKIVKQGRHEQEIYCRSNAGNAQLKCKWQKQMNDLYRSLNDNVELLILVIHNIYTTWNPKTMFNSFPLNQVTAYVFCATASDSPPIPKTNRPICIIVKLPSNPPPANMTWPSKGDKLYFIKFKTIVKIDNYNI